jgi:dTMP kinase
MDSRRLITFEGPDRVGKTTQIHLLRDWLERQGQTVVLAREPGGTVIGERIRALLLDAAVSMRPTTEMLLFAAARAELVDRVVQPALEAGHVVLLDRYVDSSVAYQGFGLNLGPEVVRNVNRVATGGLEPGLTILLLGRGFETNPGPLDRMEQRGRTFAERVREGYRRLAAESSRIQIVDAEEPRDVVALHVRAAVAAHLGLDPALDR